jgi:hypothetical protein
LTRKTARKTLFKEDKAVQKENVFVFGNSRRIETVKQRKVLANKLENPLQESPVKETVVKKPIAKKLSKEKLARENSKEIEKEPMMETTKPIEEIPVMKPIAQPVQNIVKKPVKILEKPAVKFDKSPVLEVVKEPVQEDERKPTKRASKESIKVLEKKSSKENLTPLNEPTVEINDTVMETTQTYNFKFTVNNIKTSRTKLFKLYKCSLDTQLKMLKKPVDSWIQKFEDIEKYCGEFELKAVQETHEEIEEINRKLRDFEMSLKKYEFEEASEEATEEVKSSWLEILDDIKDAKTKIESAKDIVGKADRLKAAFARQQNAVDDGDECSTPVRRSVRIMQKHDVK